MALENTVLSERSRHKRPHITGFHSYEMSRIGKSIQRGSRLVVGGEEGQGGSSDC